MRNPSPHPFREGWKTVGLAEMRTDKNYIRWKAIRKWNKFADFEESEEYKIAGDIPEPFSRGNADSKTRSLLRTFVRFRMQILEARWLAGWLASVSSTLYRAIVMRTHAFLFK